MAQEFARIFYNSKSWISCRSAYIADRIRVDGGLCERCGCRPGKIVHHRQYLTPQNISDPTISLCAENLEYVCLDCHNREHNGKRQPRCVFDAWGYPLPPSGGMV